MKSSRNHFALVFAAAALAFSAAASYVVDTARRISLAVADAFTVAVSLFKRSDPHFPERGPQVLERIGLVQAKAYLMRLAQRPRPEDTSLWRMSPAN